MVYAAAFLAGAIFGAIGIVIMALNCAPEKKEEGDM